MNKNKKRIGGFTLIEVLITITIIGIMSTLTIVSYKNYVTMSNESATKQELAQVAEAYEIGLFTEKFSNSNTTIDYATLKQAYLDVTGYDLPYSETEITYANNVLTLSRRDVTAKYDFKTKKITIE